MAPYKKYGKYCEADNLPLCCRSKDRSQIQTLRYPGPEDWGLNRVISVISVVLQEATLTTLDSTGKTVLINAI